MCCVGRPPTKQGKTDARFCYLLAWSLTGNCRVQNTQTVSLVRRCHAQVTKPPSLVSKPCAGYKTSNGPFSEKELDDLSLRPPLYLWSAQTAILCLSFRCNKIAISLLSNYGEEPKVLSGGTSERGGWERDHSSSFYRVSLENIENHLKLKYQMVIKKLLIPKIMITQIMDTEIVGS